MDDVTLDPQQCLPPECHLNESEVDNNTWSYVCEFDPPTENFMSSSTFQTFVFLMYGAVFALALTGNVLVCFVVYTASRMKTVTNYFIVNLAIGDILMTVFCVPFTFVPALVLSYWPFGAIMCKVVNYVQAVSVMVSAYTLLAISIDRYMAIMKPLQPRLGKKETKMVVTAVWVSAFATAAPIPIVSQLQKPSIWHEVCDVDICAEKWTSRMQSEQYTCALLMLQFVIPLGALVCTYTRIGIVVWGGRPPGEAQTDRDMRLQNSKKKMVKMMVTVVCVFIVCWLPLNILIVLNTLYEGDDGWHSWPALPYVWFACHWLAMSQSCYNPIIYTYMNATYRRGFKQILGRVFCFKLVGTRRQRSSYCDPVPLSEMVAVNYSTLQRRTQSCCRIERSGFDANGCTNCNMCSHVSNRFKSISEVSQRPRAAPRTVSVRSEFTF